MKNRCRKFVAAFVLLFMLIHFMPFFPGSASSEVYYGEAYLELETDAKRLAYQLVEQGVAGLSPVIEFQGVLEIGYWDLADVLRAVCVDHPQYFWFLEEGLCNYDAFKPGDYIASFEPKYILDGRTIDAGSQELADAMYAFHTKVQKIIDGIPVNYTTEYEIALYLHDYLARNVSYTLEGEHPSAYAALIKGQAACYGYSKAYQCLLNAAGIRARTITGDSPDENGKLIGHAWNQIWLDGKCFYSDVTWDDQEEIIFHTYFAMPLSEISKDHFADKEFILPECSHEPVNYYALSAGTGVGRWSEHTDAAAVAANFRFDGVYADGAVFYCETQFTSSGFLTWFSRNMQDIFDQMGLSEKAEAYYYEFHGVYFLTLVDRFASTPVVERITLPAESIHLVGQGAQYHLRPQVLSDRPWLPALVYTSSDKTVATVDTDGFVTAVSEGTAQITVSSVDGSVSAVCNVTVDKAPEHEHTMRLFTSKDPTCTQAGHADYYLCTDCGCRFGDENGAVPYTQTSDYTLPATHQRLFLVSQGDYHVQRCKCGAELTETKEKHTDSDGDGICEVCNLSTSFGDFKDPVTVPKPVEKQDTSPDWITPTIICGAVVVGIVLFVVVRRRRRGY